MEKLFEFIIQNELNTEGIFGLLENNDIKYSSIRYSGEAVASIDYIYTDEGIIKKIKVKFTNMDIEDVDIMQLITNDDLDIEDHLEPS